LQGYNEFISLELFSLSLFGALIIYTLAVSESCMGHHSRISSSSSSFCFMKFCFSFAFSILLGCKREKKRLHRLRHYFVDCSFLFLFHFSRCAHHSKKQQTEMSVKSPQFSFFFFSKNVFFFCLNFEFYPAVFPGTIRFELCPSHALVYSFISTHTHKFSASTCAQSKITREFIKCCYFIYFFKKF
jgi:hypothetical protein